MEIRTKFEGLEILTKIDAETFDKKTLQDAAQKVIEEQMYVLLKNIMMRGIYDLLKESDARQTPGQGPVTKRTDE